MRRARDFDRFKGPTLEEEREQMRSIEQEDSRKALVNAVKNAVRVVNTGLAEVAKAGVRIAVQVVNLEGKDDKNPNKVIPQKMLLYIDAEELPNYDEG